AVIRFEQKGIVENIAVGVKNVEFAVAVQIDKLDTAAAIRRVGSRIESLSFELAVALVDERDDSFVLLGEQRYKVGLGVAVQIGDDNVNAAMPVVERSRYEFWLVPIRGLIFQVQQLTRRLPAEDTDDEVLLSDSAEIGGLHVGDSADIFQQ